MDNNHWKIGLLVTSLIALPSYSAAASANAHEAPQNSPLGLSLLMGMESYLDSPHSSLSRGAGVSFIWDEMRDPSSFKIGQGVIQTRFTYYYEKDSEVYDIDRFRSSGDAKFIYQVPFAHLGAHHDYLLSFQGRYEGHYNSQQLEEFEQLALAGLALERRFSDINHFDVGLILAAGFSEEEKDDDWPREQLGHDTDVLGRSGFGLYMELNNSYTFSHTGVQLQGSISRYAGHWFYDDNQFYEVNKFNVRVIVPLANQNNLLRFSGQIIAREYELDLIGFKDTLYRAGIEYLHYF
ncbi:hypothetical protein [Shewanella sp. SR44-3]|uniref:hypothetical protein n=1 Tax=Shewanella sp. SR44-3 TaxID=2760936 RepID=UPI0015FB9A5F|nr:hypothetical protein [Shewanella sp. SR44-3]MBB1268833.1 hypothetical protein [Shewanella sp. SR44-3]